MRLVTPLTELLQRYETKALYREMELPLVPARVVLVRRGGSLGCRFRCLWGPFGVLGPSLWALVGSFGGRLTPPREDRILNGNYP